MIKKVIVFLIISVSIVSCGVDQRPGDPIPEMDITEEQSSEGLDDIPEDENTNTSIEDEKKIKPNSEKK